MPVPLANIWGLHIYLDTSFIPYNLFNIAAVAYETSHCASVPIIARKPVMAPDQRAAPSS
jgi:hypothetical protein